MSNDGGNVTSDITVYGATGFVGKYIAEYLLESASAHGKPIRLVLAGRNKAKLEQRMQNLTAKDGSTMEVYVADSSDLDGLTKMASQTKVVIACAGPFARYGTNVVAACAATGTDYVDITGEFSWVAQMRQMFGETAKKSGSRIISLSGFDSIPSDLSIFAAVDALREVRGERVEIERGTTWHYFSGVANAGTVHTMADMPIDVKKMFLDSSGSLRKAPFLIDDPLCLTHPTMVRHNPDFDEKRNMFALAEWWNNLPSFDGVLGGGMSLAFFMAPVNAKVIQASSVALNYGPKFRYYERWVILGFGFTRALGVVSALPALVVQIFLAVVMVLFKIPHISQRLLDSLYPPGSGPPDSLNRMCSCEVYAEVTAKAAAPTQDGNVDRAACHIIFAGDAGNLVTAQVVSESALALLHDHSNLPPKSDDGFGTPAELIGKVLLKRLMESKVRKVDIYTKVQKDGPKLNLVPLA
jgi:short subunit dehydrogenase-like uncharacterized protein